MIQITCKCGIVFNEKPSHSWRKYCSRPCGYKYRDMSGMKGRKIIFRNPHPNWYKAGEMVNEAHPLWKGDNAGYRAIHIWINNHRPKTGVCEHCMCKKRTDWSNISGDYLRDLEDWIELCRKCHKAVDKHTPGIIRRRFA